MALDVTDRLAIHELIARYGHLVDAGELDRLTDVVTADCRYDVTALGGSVLVGPEAIRAAALALGDANPVAHVVTSTVVTDPADGDAASTSNRVTARSTGLGVMADGSVGAVTYDDVLTQTATGWRIAARTVRSRRRPLTP